MFRELITVSEIEVGGRSYVARYFQLRTARGGRRFSCEVLLAPSDRIILDDDSLQSLETRIARLVPATIDSRILAAKPSVAA
jgi:hypothetical protein